MSDYQQLRDAVEALYYAAHWRPDRECAADDLWAKVKAAANLPDGLTQVRLGPPRQPGRENIKAIRAALNRASVAIDDWLHQYASELCDKDSVAESAERIGQLGTLGYIADVQSQIRNALDLTR